MTPPYRILPYDRQRHGDGPWRVVSAVFEEYGWPFAEGDYDADLLHPDVHYRGAGRAFVVAEDPSGEVVGCVGVTDEGEGTFELHRLYVLARARRAGLGEALVRWALAQASDHGARRMVLSSDVSFLDAHRLYQRLGFRLTRFRYAPDPWRSPEWCFERVLR